MGDTLIQARRNALLRGCFAAVKGVSLLGRGEASLDGEDARDTIGVQEKAARRPVREMCNPCARTAQLCGAANPGCAPAFSRRSTETVLASKSSVRPHTEPRPLGSDLNIMERHHVFYRHCAGYA